MGREEGSGICVLHKLPYLIALTLQGNGCDSFKFTDGKTETRRKFAGNAPAQTWPRPDLNPTALGLTSRCPRFGGLWRQQALNLLRSPPRGCQSPFFACFHYNAKPSPANSMAKSVSPVSWSLMQSTGVQMVLSEGLLGNEQPCPSHWPPSHWETLPTHLWTLGFDTFNSENPSGP